MAGEIMPALTPEQWSALWYEERGEHGQQYFAWSVPFGSASEAPESGTRPSMRGCHATAALALHGQPFGFTHKDVKMLRSWSDHEHARGYTDGGIGLDSLANRIDALLPPEDGG